MSIWTIFGCGALCGIGVMVLIQTALEHWRKGRLRREYEPWRRIGEQNRAVLERGAFQKAQTTAQNLSWPHPSRAALWGIKAPKGFAAQAPYKAGQRPNGAA